MSGERQSDEDEEAIRELLDRQVTGWDAGDAAAYASVFTPDAGYVTFLGSHYRGRDVIAASYVPLFTTLLKGSRLHTEITQLRFLTPDVALIHAKAAVVKSGRRRTRRNARVNTTIAVRTDGRWLLASSQNTTHCRFAEKLFHKLASRTAPSPVAAP
jgi:uncharacterized protein (TIGR02246 family)